MSHAIGAPAVPPIPALPPPPEPVMPVPPTNPITLPKLPERPQRNLLREPHVASFSNLLRTNAGDASSVLSIAGAGALFLPQEAALRAGPPLVAASLLAGGLDTVYNAANWLGGDHTATFGSTVYAATGLLPASSMLWANYLRHRPGGGEIGRLVALGANVALIGYELGYRVPRIADHKENASGYLAMGAALSGVMMKAR